MRGRLYYGQLHSQLVLRSAHVDPAHNRLYFGSLLCWLSQFSFALLALRIGRRKITLYIRYTFCSNNNGFCEYIMHWTLCKYRCVTEIVILLTVAIHLYLRDIPISESQSSYPRMLRECALIPIYRSVYLTRDSQRAAILKPFVSRARLPMHHDEAPHRFNPLYYTANDS